MEWASYRAAAPKHSMAWTLTCTGQEDAGEHPAGCFAANEYARVVLPDESGEGGRAVVMSPDTVLEYVGDTVREWNYADPLERLRSMEVCVPGLMGSEHTPWLGAAWHVLGIEGVAESFSALPYPGGVMQQPTAMVEALSIIRATRNAIQDRNLQKARTAGHTRQLAQMPT